MMESTEILGGQGRQCKNCAFFVNHGFEDRGTCQRYAPKPIVYDLKDESNMCVIQPAIWPAVEYHEFCGEFVDERQFHSYNK